MLEVPVMFFPPCNSSINNINTIQKKPDEFSGDDSDKDDEREEEKEVEAVEDE